MKIAVLCSGRGSNLLALLEAHAQGKIPGAEFVAVIADSRDAGALNIGREYGLQASVVPRAAFHANREGFERRLLEVLAPHEIELVVLAGFQRVLGATFLDAYPGRVVNIHPALLPAFPGHMVWADEVQYGVKLAGATVHFVDAGVDSGPIIIQGAVPVLPGDGPDELAKRILAVEHRIFPQAVAWLVSGKVTLAGRVAALKGFAPTPEQISQTFVWPPLED
ncbi:MAG: phosphoribosylglycinamide formyltransferase [Deltaproteobacteria bacterium]|jgi:phosphoribosylglycinamide formyltransferase-1|nr:phosphoribosylglycinamide formyltransferase [Deltaproteobacteria bacterium]